MWLTSLGYTEPQGQVSDAVGVVFGDSFYANFGRSVICQQVWLGPVRFDYGEALLSGQADSGIASVEEARELLQLHRPG